MMRRFVLLSLFLLLGAYARAAKPAEETIYFPPVYNLQMLNEPTAIALTWNWDKPIEMLAFRTLSFEIQRGTTTVATVPSNQWTDQGLSAGHYAYRVRAIGLLDKKKNSTRYVSEWSEAIETTIESKCTERPTIQLKVESKQAVYRKLATIRLHLTGRVTQNAACSIQKASYQIDRGVGLAEDGALIIRTDNSFDQYIDAVEADENSINAEATFTVSATVENEAGGVSAEPYTFTVQKRNPFAPY